MTQVVHLVRQQGASDEDLETARAVVQAAATKCAVNWSGIYYFPSD